MSVVMNGDPVATAKILVDELGGGSYIHAIQTAVTYAKSNNYRAASFWRQVADHIGVKSDVAAEVPALQTTSS